MTRVCGLSKRKQSPTTAPPPLACRSPQFKHRRGGATERGSILASIGPLFCLCVGLRQCRAGIGSSPRKSFLRVKPFRPVRVYQATVLVHPPIPPATRAVCRESPGFFGRGFFFGARQVFAADSQRNVSPASASTPCRPLFPSPPAPTAVRRGCSGCLQGFTGRPF